MIEGKKINIRIFREADLEDYLHFANKVADVGEFWPVTMFSEMMIRKMFLEDGLWGENGGKLLITDKNNKMIGNLNLYRGIRYVDGFEIGYRVFRPEDRGKGYTTEAIRLFTPYMFRLKPINRLQICCVPGNIGSIKAAEKCGYQYEGTMRQATYIKGKFHDVNMYSMLREDWEKLYPEGK